MARRNQGVSVDAYYAALSKLRDGAVAPVMVIAGEEELFRRQALDAVLEGMRKIAPGIQMVTLQGPSGRNESSLPIGAVLEEVQSRSLFAAEKLVVVRRAQLFLFPQKTESSATGKAASPEDALLAYLNEPTEGMYLLFEVESVNRARRVGKALDSKAMTVECPVLKWERDVASWLDHAAHEWGKTLTPHAKSMLYMAHGAQPGTLWQELEKLSIFMGDQPQIDEDAVRTFMGDSVAFSVYELSGAIEERDEHKALVVSRRILEQGISDKGKSVDMIGSVHIALGALHACLLGIWQAQDVLRAGGDMAELESRLGAARFRARFLMAAARRYAGVEIAAAFIALADGMASLHDTAADPQLTLDTLVHTICGKRRERVVG